MYLQKLRGLNLEVSCEVQYKTLKLHEKFSFTFYSCRFKTFLISYSYFHYLTVYVFTRFSINFDRLNCDIVGAQKFQFHLKLPIQLYMSVHFFDLECQSVNFWAYLKNIIYNMLIDSSNIETIFQNILHS